MRVGVVPMLLGLGASFAFSPCALVPTSRKSGAPLMHLSRPRTHGPPRLMAAWRPSVPADLEVSDDDALWALGKMERVDVSVAAAGLPSTSIATTFTRAGERSPGRPRLLFLHGADSNSLEWRKVIRALSARGHECIAVDWWGGGWTDRRAITDACKAQPAPPTPWTFIRAHLRALWEQQLGAEPLIVVGASLGGACALDLVANEPEMAAALVLVDAGGQSFKAPPPDVVTALAPVALGVKTLIGLFQSRVAAEDVRIVAMHSNQPLWLEAGKQYLRSGSYARVVGPDLIRSRVRPPTLVVWGEDDDILPLADAYAFKRDLADCRALEIVPGAGHCPQLENAPPVADAIDRFVASLAPDAT